MSGRRRVKGLAAALAATVVLLSACASGTTVTAGPGNRPTAGGTPAAASLSASNPDSIPGAPSAPTGPTEDATLVRVVDGDTIRAVVGGKEYRIRFIGMNTPELNQGSAATPEPFAELATQANARLLAGGRLVLERDVSRTDRYDRLLRDIWIEADGQWTLVNLALVDQGYAQVSTFPPDVKYVDALVAAERAARAYSRGLWGSAP
ncbi:MAG: thermonuclease family protein [Chloroflexota bacterium]